MANCNLVYGHACQGSIPLQYSAEFTPPYTTPPARACHLSTLTMWSVIAPKTDRITGRQTAPGVNLLGWWYAAQLVSHCWPLTPSVTTSSPATHHAENCTLTQVGKLLCNVLGSCTGQGCISKSNALHHHCSQHHARAAHSCQCWQCCVKVGLMLMKHAYACLRSTLRT
jgi:hypothetical protein